ncbi:hypothetical protein RIF23_01650 [Lipingzhangella sp. LS1_29]|uniref:Uncharacterized protein n=1 Tax=Lipingzhangella rawalii TaxID=2055835 RepID=A0ABU2H117_9ACTN|nr:hypothetical protein [Lipingzhangella rawalii]MDS1268993.1 hypothetical protein [Lipingzhangella rawalii]
MYQPAPPASPVSAGLTTVVLLPRRADTERTDLAVVDIPCHTAVSHRELLEVLRSTGRVSPEKREPTRPHNDTR